jgi:hypothetical protein
VIPPEPPPAPLFSEDSDPGPPGLPHEAAPASIRARVGDCDLPVLNAFCRQLVVDQQRQVPVEVVSFWVRVPFGSPFHRYTAGQSLLRRDHPVRLADAGVVVAFAGQIVRVVQNVTATESNVEIYLTSVGELTLRDPDAPAAPAADAVVLPATILDAWADAGAGDAP